jgi:hypothetical protein
MEDTAEMQTESMLELADAIRDEMGSAQSEAFTNTVKPALEAMYGVMETTRVALTQGVGMLTGEAEPMDTMGAEEPDMDMEPTVDDEADVTWTLKCQQMTTSAQQMQQQAAKKKLVVKSASQ